MNPMKQYDILIVDDEPDLASALAERLEIRGFQVEVAVNGEDALLLTGKADFDVVIIDMKMPGMDGLKLMSEIKRERPSTKIILFTGHGSASDIKKGMRDGASTYLVKPVDIEKLIDAVNKIMDKEGE